MATKVAIAIARENAIQSLKETGVAIARLLAIDPPQLDAAFNDKDYQQAEELKALAAFNQRVHTALERDANVSETKKASSRRNG